MLKPWIKLILLSIILAGCGGGGESAPQNNNPPNNNNNSGVTPVAVEQNLSLKMSTALPIDRSAGGVILVNIRSIANDNSILQDETVAASPATNANSTTDWGLDSDITLDQHGGRVIINASADGFITYGATAAYANPRDFEFRGNLASTSVVSVDIPANRTGNRSDGETQDRYISLRLSKDSASGTVKLTANKSAALDGTGDNEFGIDIPLDEIPADVTQLNAEMKGFDSSNDDDNLYFPGEYADSDGNDLLSIAFNFVELTDQDGRNLGEATAAARTANRMAAKNTVPTIITRTIPPGSCPSVNDLGDANAAQAGLQIPVYTYNPNSGLWDLLGYGTVTDSADVSPAPGFLDCDNVTYRLSIEVDNEDFLRKWWNLDYPLVFSEPTELCVKIRLVDSNGDPVAGVWVSLYDDDNRSFNTQFGFTDSNGEISFTTIELDNSGDRSAELRFWSYSSKGYRTETVQLSEDCSSVATTEIVLTHADLCQVEGKTVLDTDPSQGLAGTTLYLYGSDGINFDVKYLITDADGDFRGSVLCNADYGLSTWPSPTLNKVTFNVDGEVATSEASDDANRVILHDIPISNLEPLAAVYISAASDSSYHTGNDSLTAPLTAGTHATQIMAYDLDGHYPIAYSLQVRDSGDSVIQTIAGTVADWNGMELLEDLSIPQDGNYTISFDISDSLGATGSANIFVLPYPVVQ